MKPSQTSICLVEIKFLYRQLLNKLGFRNDPWIKQKYQLELLWLKVFNHRIDWDQYVLPRFSKEYSVLGIRPGCFTQHQIIKKIRRFCHKNELTERSEYMYNLDNELAKAIEIQYRPLSNYAWAHKGHNMPDPECMGSSYSDMKTHKEGFMVPIEYILSSFFAEFTNGELYDENDFTILAVMEKDGYVLGGCRKLTSGFHIVRIPTDKMQNAGPRRVRINSYYYDDLGGYLPIMYMDV